MNDRPANRLAQETSPYLLQHAHNPVDWYPWSEEAFQAAKQTDRPIFLSVGYSACHWCHVMERESFENEQIATLMNQHFINIKVDREERPDLDAIYMAAVQLMTHRGGWPMSVFMTPDQKPFFGGTYWPPSSRHGMPGFREILLGVHEAWTNRRQEVLQAAQRLTTAIGDHFVVETPTPLVEIGAASKRNSPLLRGTNNNSDPIPQAAEALLSRVDRTYGGFGRAPKFPHSMDLQVLLRAARNGRNQQALEAATLTLERMANGGIYDHLGGGFHRYSTDERWLVPHFEKMLYDNALLIPCYLEAYQLTNRTDFLRTATESLDYVLREMTQPEGGFYSTQDADSEGIEGKYFVWSEEEIREHLDPEEARLLTYLYDVTPHGNWEETNILNRLKSDEQAASILRVQFDSFQSTIQTAREKLKKVRDLRIPPGRDEKILVSWNGLMISACAMGYQVTGDHRYLEAAERAVDFILTKMRDPSGRLLHCYKDDRARFPAYSDDYACLMNGLVDLYQANFELRYFDMALELSERLIHEFWDNDTGGLFYTSHHHEHLIARHKEYQDNATPSANAMAATGWAKLARITGGTELTEKLERIFLLTLPMARQHPMAAGQMLVAHDNWTGPALDLVLIDGPDHSVVDRWLGMIHQQFLPGKIVLRPHAKTPENPLLQGKNLTPNQSTAYICLQGTCSLPITEEAEFTKAIQTSSEC